MKNLSSGAKNDKYFRIDHLKNDLKKRSVRGGAVTMITQIFKFCLNMGSNVLLARLLTPEDYGLIGMVTAVTGFVTSFKDLGLSMATVQKDEINHEQVSTLFWMNMALSITTALICAAIAPAIAWFYNEPRLIWITLSLTVGFIMGGLGVQHTALLNRQMQYKVLMFNDLLSMLLGVVAAIIAASLGFGYWALVILPLVIAFVSTTGVWIACGWRPGLPKRQVGVRSMLIFGGHLTGFRIISYFARNLDNILIGRYWGSQQLGLYAKAYQLLVLPIHQINTPISHVAIPSLSRLQNEPQKFRHYFIQALSIVAFLTMPIIIFMMLASEEIIVLLLGSQWREASEIFRFLSLSALVQPLWDIVGLLYVSTGKTDRMFKWGVFSSLLIVVSFFIGLPYGASGVALSYSTTMLLLAIPCMYYATRGLPITLLDLLNTLKQPFIASLMAGIAMFAVKIAISSSFPILINVIACFIVMSSIYLIIMLYLFRMKSFYLGILRNLKG